MSALTNLGRRQFLGMLGSTSLLSSVPALSLAKPQDTDTGKFKPDLELEIRAAPDEMSLFSGRPTQVWRCKAKVLQVEAHAVTTLFSSYLGLIHTSTQR